MCVCNHCCYLYDVCARLRTRAKLSCTRATHTNICRCHARKLFARVAKTHLVWKLSMRIILRGNVMFKQTSHPMGANPSLMQLS